VKKISGRHKLILKPWWKTWEHIDDSKAYRASSITQQFRKRFSGIGVGKRF